MTDIPPETLSFFASCPRGLQDYLADEVQRCGGTGLEPGQAGVAFHATLQQAYLLNLTSRIASRVLLYVGGGRFRLDKDVFKLAGRVTWETHLRPEQTLRVDTKAVRVNLTSLKLITLRVKDAIVDRLREHYGERPDIDTHTPDTRVMVYLQDRQASFYVDLSGDNLFKRGWRGRGGADGDDNKGAAPIKENLAAGLIAASPWQPGMPLFDPFCGSGTIAIEAAQVARGIAAGHQREFGLQNLRSFDAYAWSAARQTAAVGETDEPYQPAAGRADDESPAMIFASDIDQTIVSVAKANVGRAGLPAHAIRFTVVDFLQTKAPCTEPGIIISNLPYGERMAFRGGGADIEKQIGQHLREHYSGWTVCLFSADLKLPGKLGLRPQRKIALYNGTLDCRLFVFEMR